MLGKQDDLATERKRKRNRERHDAEEAKKAEDNENKISRFTYGWSY